MTIPQPIEEKPENPITIIIKSKVGSGSVQISNEPVKYLNPRERHQSQEKITVIKESVL